MPQGQRYHARMRTFGISERARRSRANRMALVTSSETRIPLPQPYPGPSRGRNPGNERVYRRAQNGEVGNVTKTSMPASIGRGGLCGGTARPTRPQGSNERWLHHGLPGEPNR